MNGKSRAVGIFMVLGGMGMSGLLLWPFSCGLLVGLLASVVLAAIGAGYGFRVIIDVEGITIWRTWFGVRLPTFREHASLDACVGIDPDDDGDAFAGVRIERHELPLPGRDREALKEALLLGIEWAVAASIEKRAGQPYRSRAHTQGGGVGVTVHRG